MIGFLLKNNSNYINTNENAILYDEFLNLRLFNKYKPLEVDQINKIFGDNSNIYFLTESKTNNFEKIYKDFKFDKNRILIEIFVDLKTLFILMLKIK